MRYTIYIAILVLSFGCKKAEDRRCWKSIGELETFWVALDDFTEIELNDHLDMTVSYAPSHYIEIYTGKNLVNHIGFEINNGRLVLTDNNTCDFIRNLGHKTSIHVHAPTITHIELKGSGNSKGILSGDRFQIDVREANGSHEYRVNHDTVRCLIHDGAADFLFNGTANSAYYYHFGSGTINAKDLQANEVVINWLSINDLFLSATTRLSGSIDSFGDVYYYGTPTINVGTSSSGQLIKAD